MRNALLLAAILIMTTVYLAAALVAPCAKPPREAVLSGWETRVDDPVLAALRRAKLAGDYSLAAELAGGALASGARTQSAAAVRVVDRSGDRDAGGIGSDVLVNDPSWSSGSPALASALDGTLYCAVDDRATHHIDIYGSYDGGAVWLYFWSILPAADATEPALAIAEDGDSRYVILAYIVGNETADAGIQVYYQETNGAVTGFVDVEQAAYAQFSAPSLCVDSPEYPGWFPYLTWTRFVLGFDRDSYSLRFSRSTDRCVNWSAPVELAADVRGGGRPSIDFGGTRLFCAFERTGPGADADVYMRRSEDFGGNWQAEIGLAVTAMDEISPSVAASVNDDLVVIAFDRHYAGTGHDIDAMISTDAGGVWTSSYLPYTSGDETEPVLAASLDLSRIHALYKNPDGLVLTNTDAAAPGDWNGLLPANRSTIPDPGDRHSLVANPAREGEALAAWGVNTPDLHAVYAGGAYPLGRYLIIAANAAVGTAAAPFVAWKESIGFDVSVVTFADVRAAFPAGDDAEGISAYLSFHGARTRHVLLLGDIDTLPMRMLYPDGDQAYAAGDPKHHNGGAFGSDYYYAKPNAAWDLDGDDRWGEFTDDLLDPEADLLVGRVPFNDTALIAQWCLDLVAFEQNTGGWKRNVLMAHGFMHFPGSPGHTASDTGKTGELMRTNILNPAGWGYSRLYEKGGISTSPYPSEEGLSLGNYELYSSDGFYGIVSIMAHGSRKLLASHRWLRDFNENFLADLPGEWCYNIVTTANSVQSHPVGSFTLLTGCSTGILFDYDPTFMASSLRSRYLIRNTVNGTMIKQYLAAGAPAVIASSAGSDYGHPWDGPGDQGTQSLIYHLVDNVITHGMSAGEAFYAAQLTYFTTVRPQRGIRVFNYFGDPSLRIEGATPPGGAPIPFANRGPRRELRSEREEGERVEPAELWTETAELDGCMAASALLALPGGEILAGGVARVDTLSNQGALYRSADGGDSWMRQDLPDCWAVNALAATGSGALLAGGVSAVGPSFGATIHRSGDGGQTWTPVFTAEDGGVTALDPGLGDQVWATGGWNGAVYVSDDDGLSWSQWGSVGPDATILALLPTNDGGVIAALDESESLPAILRSDDGSNWSPVDLPLDFFAARALIELDGILYAGVRDESGGWVIFSEDDGWTWQSLPEFPDPQLAVSVRCLAAGEEGDLLVGLSSGRGPAAGNVVRLPAGGDFWEPAGGLLDLANDVDALLAGGGLIYAATGPLYGKVFVRLSGAGTGVEETPLPVFARLSPPWPNPANPRTTLRFELERGGRIALSIYDERGRRLRDIVDSRLAAGVHEATWDGRDDAGRMLPSGQYLVRLSRDGEFLPPARKVVLLK